MKRRVCVALVVGLVTVTACSSSKKPASSQPSTSSAASAIAVTTTTAPAGRNTAAKSTCAYNVATEAFTGAFGTASAIGWAGNAQGVVTCLGGSFYVQGAHNQRYGFGIYAGGPTTWVDADGYLPAQITTFTDNAAPVTITEFADEVTLGGHAFVAVYSRVAIENPTSSPITADPGATAGLVALRTAPAPVAAHSTAVHDYVLAVDRFGNSYAWPTAQALVAAGSFDQHYAHMRAFWNGQLAQIANVSVPDAQLVDAYRSGFIYTQIARSGTHLNTGVNNYEAEFSHDVIGILANLFTQGDFAGAHALLIEARSAIGPLGQYEDGVWTYSWPWALYLMKTGDLAFVKANFATSSVAGQPSIEQTAHRIATDRTGPSGIIGMTNDIDSNGYWTVDDYEALTGLAAYRYLAQQVGNSAEARWASNEYDSLLAAVNLTLAATIHKYGLSYLPCSMLQPNTANRCRNPNDANWAAPFLFGRWAWDAQLLGETVSGPGAQLIDATYTYGFQRLAGRLPANTFGGYPSDYYSTGYNAGYGSWGLASALHRDQGVVSYEFMIANTQSGPYSWWESASPPSATTPWGGSHPAAGQGSSPHAWGIANANKVLLDSLVAQRSDGALIVGRGVPNAWITSGNAISVTNFPTTKGARTSISISSGDRSVTLKLTGSRPPGTVLFELPIFVDNIASSTAGTIDQKTGTVRLSPSDTTVTVRLGDTPS